MPQYTALGFASPGPNLDFLEKEYTWVDEKRDQCGSYITKDDIPEWLDNPTILYYDEDIEFNDGEDSDRWQIEHAVENDLTSIEGVKARFKDKNLAVRVEREGGVLYFIQDSDHRFVALLWVGKTSEEIFKLIANKQDEDQRLEVTCNLRVALQGYLDLFGKEQLRSAFEEFCAVEPGPGLGT